MSLCVVIEFDMEEADANQSVRNVYGPFDDEDKAEAWASARYEEIDEELKEYTGLEVEIIGSPDGWKKDHE